MDQAAYLLEIQRQIHNFSCFFSVQILNLVESTIQVTDSFYSAFVNARDFQILLHLVQERCQKSTNLSYKGKLSFISTVNEILVV